MAEDFRDPAEPDHVHAALAPLYLRHEALMAVQAGGQLDLRDAGGLTGRDEEVDEFLMPLREDRRWQ